MAGVLKQGDCLALLAEIESNSVDLLVTDPPYCVGTTSNGNKGTWTDNNLIVPFFERYFDEIVRVLKDGASFYVNTDWRTYPLLYPVMASRLAVRNLIVWDYEWIKAGLYYRYRHEFIVFGSKGRLKREFSASEADVWRVKPVNYTKGRHHQAQKPVELVERMIANSSKPGDVVLDTFAGSGTTAIACQRTGREFVGFEICPGTFATACERIRRETKKEYVFS